MTTIVVAAILQVVGDSRWQTSVFLQKESGGFFLPIKAQVRRAEGLVPGETITARIILEK